MLPTVSPFFAAPEAASASAGLPGTTAARTSRATSRPRGERLLVIGTALLLTLLAAVTVGQINSGERRARQVVAALLETSAHGIDAAIDRQLLPARAALDRLPILLSGLSGDDTPDITPRTTASLLRALRGDNASFYNVALVDASGKLWASAGEGPAGTLAGFDPAAILGQAESLPNLVGPLRNPVTGNWSIFLHRRVDVPGHAEMTAVAEISVPGLFDEVARIRHDLHTRVRIEKWTGEVIATLPYQPELVGTRASSPLASLRPLDTMLTLPGSGPADEAFAVVKLTGLDEVYVSIALDARVALADWEAERTRILATALVVALLVLAVATTILRLIGQSQRLALQTERAALILKGAIEGMGDGFVMWDTEDRFVACNEVYRDIYVQSRAYLVPGAPFETIIRGGAENGQYPDAVTDIDAFVAGLVEWHRAGEGTLERQLPDGRWMLIRERRLESGGMVGIRTDITALKSAQAELAAATARAESAAAAAEEQNRRLQEREQELNIQNTRFEVALNNMPHGLLMVDAQERLIVANPHVAAMFGIETSVFRPGVSVREIARHVRRVGRIDFGAMVQLARGHADLANAREQGSFTVATAAGTMLEITQRPLDEGGWVAVYEDVTLQMRAEGQVRFLAHHDELTKLPNRACFRAEVDRRVADLRADESRGFTLLLLDLDRFKDVNDMFGHPMGDALLRSVAERLVAEVQPQDFVTRLGGDEFAVIRGSAADAAELKRLADRIIASLSLPYDLLERRVTVGASIGIADAAGVSSEELLRNADLALYRAKSLGRGVSCMFDPELERRRSFRVLLEHDLREALERRAFTVAYQPIFDLREGHVSGFEALLRWHHPKRGWVSPAEFVPLAEEVGLIDQIGAWVLETACRDVAQLPRALRVAVNLSARQLRSDGIIETVDRALRDSGLPAERLELEITETALLADSKASADILQRLSGRGLRIALDDFGTGYSSISHLRSFPLDKIKIDRSFVGEMASNRESAAIVTAVIQLADKLGMTTTAEGVESPFQLKAIRAAGCTEAQGFLLGRPTGILRAIEVVGTTLQGKTAERRSG